MRQQPAQNGEAGEAYVYMVRCAGGQLYTGWTNDPQSRLYAHRSGKGARATRAMGAKRLAYLERCAGKSEALRREAALKKLKKPQKEALCAAWAEQMRPRLSVATKADAADIVQLYNWYVLHHTATFQITPSTVEQYEAWVERTLACAPLLLARDGTGRLMGYACAHPWHEREAFAWSVESTVYCAPWARGLGLGQTLYRPLLQLLQMRGYWNVYALIADPNPASEALHKSLGYQCQGRTPRTGYKLGRWLGLSTWALQLQKGLAAPGPLRPLPDAEVQAVLAHWQPSPALDMPGRQK